jgi:hypothetical protein
MGLNLSNNQISKELDLNRGDVHNMTAQLRQGVVKKPRITLQDELECDEVYIVHNVGKQGKFLLHSLIEVLIK